MSSKELLLKNTKIFLSGAKQLGVDLPPYVAKIILPKLTEKKIAKIPPLKQLLGSRIDVGIHFSYQTKFLKDGTLIFHLESGLDDVIDIDHERKLSYIGKLHKNVATDFQSMAVLLMYDRFFNRVQFLEGRTNFAEKTGKRHHFPSEELIASQPLRSLFDYRIPKPSWSRELFSVGAPIRSFRATKEHFIKAHFPPQWLVAYKYQGVFEAAVNFRGFQTKFDTSFSKANQQALPRLESADLSPNLLAISVIPNPGNQHHPNHYVQDFIQAARYGYLPANFKN